jgi:ribosomal-protein-serine acetyltransferase
MYLSQPLQKIKIDEQISLELINDQHAEPLLTLVNKNRAYLHRWLPWVDYMQTVENFQTYIHRCKIQLEEGTDLGYVILHNKSVAGRIGLHYINLLNRQGAIGYWIGEEFSGKGIVTKSCQAIINICFRDLKLNRVELKCGMGNKKSVAVAERLNFTHEGVLREAELVNDQFIDLNLFSILKKEWQQANQY